MKELLKALSKAKSEIGAISKDSTNPFFKSKYFDINALIAHVEPILDSHGLMLLQPLRDGCVVSQIHHVETGQKVESSITLPTLNDPQKMGSAISYYRRYSLQSLISLQSTDDDGNHAAKPEPKKAPYETSRAKAAISKGISLDEFGKFIDMSGEQIEAFNSLKLEYTKS